MNFKDRISKLIAIAQEEPEEKKPVEILVPDDDEYEKPKDVPVENKEYIKKLFLSSGTLSNEDAEKLKQMLPSIDFVFMYHVLFDCLMNNPDFYFRNEIYKYPNSDFYERQKFLGLNTVEKAVGQIARREVQLNPSIEKLLTYLATDKKFYAHIDQFRTSIANERIAHMIAVEYPLLFLKLNLDKIYPNIYSLQILGENYGTKFNQSNIDRLKKIEQDSGKVDIVEDYLESFYTSNFSEFVSDMINDKLKEGTTTRVIDDVIDNYLSFAPSDARYVGGQEISSMNRFFLSDDFLRKISKFPSFKNKVMIYYDLINKSLMLKKLTRGLNDNISDQETFLRNTIRLIKIYPDLRREYLMKAIDNLKNSNLIYRNPEVFTTSEVKAAAKEVANDDVIKYLEALSYDYLNLGENSPTYKNKLIDPEDMIEAVASSEHEKIYHFYMKYNGKDYEYIIKLFPFLEPAFKQVLKYFIQRHIDYVFSGGYGNLERVFEDAEIIGVVENRINEGNLSINSLNSIISANKYLNAKQRKQIVKPAVDQYIYNIQHSPEQFISLFSSGAYLYAEQENVESLLNHWLNKYADKIFRFIHQSETLKTIAYLPLQRALLKRENLNKLLELDDFDTFYQKGLFLEDIDKDISKKFAEKMIKNNPEMFFKNIGQEARNNKLHELAVEFSKKSEEEQKKVTKEFEGDVKKLTGKYSLAKEYPELIEKALRQYIKRHYINFEALFLALLESDINFYKDENIKRIVIDELINSATNENRVWALQALITDEAIEIRKYPEFFEKIAKKLSTIPEAFIELGLDKEFPNIKFQRATFFQNIDNHEVAIKNIADLQNDTELQTPKNFNLRDDQFKTMQRPQYFASHEIGRFCLSFNAAAPTKDLYDINKKLIHAGDMFMHTNVGVSGFTSAWGLVSFLPENMMIADDNNLENQEIILEQYQSDYPVVFAKLFLGKIRPNEIEEYSKLLDSGVNYDKKHKWINKFNQDNNTPFFAPLNNWIINNANQKKVKEFLAANVPEAFEDVLRLEKEEEEEENDFAGSMLSNHEAMNAIRAYKDSLDYDQALPLNLTDSLEDAKEYIGLISKNYPFLVLHGLIEFAMLNKKDYIYILADAGGIANIANKKKVNYLYKEVPEFLDGRIVTFNQTADEEFWKIPATKDNLAKLKSRMGKDKNYDFALTPEQNKKVSEKAQEEKTKLREKVWERTEEKVEKLNSLLSEIKNKLPEQSLPILETPLDAMKFLNEEIKGKIMSKTKFTTEFGRIIQELGKMSRAYLLINFLRKNAYYIPGPTKMPQPIKQNPDYGMDFITRLKKRKKKLKKLKNKKAVELSFLKAAQEDLELEQEQLEKGIKIELEKNTDLAKAKEIAQTNLYFNPEYYRNKEYHEKITPYIEEDWDVEKEEKDIQRLKKEEDGWHSLKKEEDRAKRDKRRRELSKMKGWEVPSNKELIANEEKMVKLHSKWLKHIDENMTIDTPKLNNEKFIVENLDTLNSFITRHGNKIPKFLGAGSFGAAFLLGDETVLKIYQTSFFGSGPLDSEEDYYNLSQKIIFKDMPGANLETYPISRGEFLNNVKYVIMEKFETQKDIYKKFKTDLFFVEKLSANIDQIIANADDVAQDRPDSEASFADLQSRFIDEGLTKKIIKLLGDKEASEDVGEDIFYRSKSDLENYKLVSKILAKFYKEEEDIISSEVIKKFSNNPEVAHDWLENLILQIIHKVKTGRIDLSSLNIGLRPSTGYFVFFDA